MQPIAAFALSCSDDCLGPIPAHVLRPSRIIIRCIIVDGITQRNSAIAAVIIIALASERASVSVSTTVIVTATATRTRTVLCVFASGQRLILLGRMYVCAARASDGREGREESGQVRGKMGRGQGNREGGGKRYHIQCRR